MDAEKVLLGDSLPLMEVEEDDDRDVTEDAELKYEMTDILEAMGKPEFESIYKVHIDKIRLQSSENQASFCASILNRIEEIYDYTFMRPFDYTDEMIQKIYVFLEFIEFNYVDFFSVIWSKIDINLLKLTNVFDYVKSNPVIIGEQILRISGNMLIPELMKEYYSTQTKDELLDLFARMTEKNKMKIVVAMTEKKFI